MGFYTGRTGKLEFWDGSSYKPVAKIRDWTLNSTVELLSTTVVDSIANTFTPGIKSATGSATLLYYRLEAGESASTAEFTALLGKIQKTGAITDNDKVKLKLRTGAASNDAIEFFAFITNADVSINTGELVTVPIQFTVDGDFLASGVIS